MNICLSLRLVLTSKSGFSFETGGWTYRPVVPHSTSGTLIPTFRSIFLPFFVTILFMFFFLLKHLLLSRLEDNRIRELEWTLALPEKRWRRRFWVFYLKNVRGGGACPQIPLGACAVGARKAPRQISRPVLSQSCPPLYKAIENPCK